MTRQLVISELFCLFYVPPTLNLNFVSANQLIKKILASKNLVRTHSSTRFSGFVNVLAGLLIVRKWDAILGTKSVVSCYIIITHILEIIRV